MWKWKNKYKERERDERNKVDVYASERHEREVGGLGCGGLEIT